MKPVEAARLIPLPLFGELDQHDLSRVAGWLRDVNLEPGAVLIEQGALPYEIFVLEEGTVEVLRDEQRIATLGAGDVVGEMGLMKQERRMATVRALTDVRAVALHADDLDAMTEAMPEIVDQLRAIAERRRGRL
ncbi:MAG: cyclic nucleotide-binding domain-containing protein [Actinomycetota bacterium]